MQPNTHDLSATAPPHVANTPIIGDALLHEDKQWRTRGTPGGALASKASWRPVRRWMGTGTGRPGDRNSGGSPLNCRWARRHRFALRLLPDAFGAVRNYLPPAA